MLGLGFVSVIILSGCSAPAQPNVSVVTDYGLGLDKWATAWLMKRHAEAGAELKVVPQGADLPPGIPFDTPASTLRRQRDHAAYQAVMDHYGLDAPSLKKMAQIIYDIEVNYWGAPDMAVSPAVEQAFRALQQRHGRYAVAPECYLAFFDRVHATIEAGKDAELIAPADLMVDCHALASETSQGALVPELSIQTLMTEMKSGKKVVFVDVREPEEFAEAHIPEAQNIQLRALDEEALARVRGADYVVSYCIKDFRGFEMARSLRDAGIPNAVILNPYGIKGWIAEGLPTVGDKALTIEEGRTRLSVCVQDPAICRAEAEAKERGGK